jgi:cobalt-precorrin 5A hydrolase
MPAKTAIFLLRQSAEPVGDKLRAELDADIIRSWEFDAKQSEMFRAQFTQRTGWILLMSTGIAVRFLDGLARDKHSDPAVVVLDEGCHHAVALLSGHEGGANHLAFQVANIVGATPVISTATESLKPLVVGIGCRKEIKAEAIENAVVTALDGRPLSDVRCVATVELKAKEPGLVEFCNKHALPLRVFTHEAVAARAWVTEPSDWVQKSIGLDGVCEPCALMTTSRGKLLVPKMKLNGVAVAIVDDSVN